MKMNFFSGWYLALSMLLVPISLCGKEKGPDICVSAEVTKSGFLDEVFTYEVNLTSSSPDISNVRVLQSPTFPEGVKVISGANLNSRPVVRKNKGNTTYTWTISRTFLIPSKEGRFTVGPGKYVVFIPQEKVIYHDFWGPRRTVEYEEIPVDSKKTEFKVSDLPTASKATDFSGCVGDFKVEGWFPPGKIVAGSEAYVVFQISGFGSLENLKVPNLNKLFVKGCSLKEVEQNEEQMQRDGRFYSVVTLTCKFVPDEEEFEINPLSFQFFNPQSRKYYEAESDMLHWTTKQAPSKSYSGKDAVEI